MTFTNNYMNSKIEKMIPAANECLARLKSDEFSQYTGWMDFQSVTDEEIQRINNVANEIRSNSDVLVVIGIGGSYLGARAVIEALTNKYNKEMEIIYLGNSLSSLDMKEALDYLETKDFTVNVISKSGTTLEPAVAFSSLKSLLFKKYSEQEALKRIVITTDKKNGTLREFVNETGVESFVIPDNVGGRFSVLTAVGLLPIATAGIDIEKLLDGARNGFSDEGIKFREQTAINYACYRNFMYKEGKEIELLVTHEPRLKYLGEWWKQLFGESEGKDGKGLFPASVTFSTDLHSIGQLIQDGKRNLFETSISFDEVEKDVIIEDDLENLSGMKMSLLNENMKHSALKAHLDGGVNSIDMKLKVLSERSIGNLIYFFELSCAISGLLLGVNPFDQPGVEQYKNNMKQLLEKERVVHDKD